MLGWDIHSNAVVEELFINNGSLVTDQSEISQNVLTDFRQEFEDELQALVVRVGRLLSCKFCFDGQDGLSTLHDVGSICQVLDLLAECLPQLLNFLCRFLTERL